MAGTIAGGKAAAETNIRKHGPDFYKRIGALGGSKSGKGGFWYQKYVAGDMDAVRRAGKKGGLKSRKGKKVDE